MCHMWWWASVSMFTSSRRISPARWRTLPPLWTCPWAEGSAEIHLVAAALLEEMDYLRREVLFAPERWLEDYRAACLNIGRTVRLLQGRYRGDGAGPEN